MPVTYAVDGLRQVFIIGADLSAAALSLDLVVLAGFAVVFAIVAALTIRRDVVNTSSSRRLLRRRSWEGSSSC